MPIAVAVSVGLFVPVVSRYRLAGQTLLCTLNVGQGDAAVIRTARGHWMVFDAGPAFGGRSAGREVIVPFMRARGARAVELFVLSHPDLDHLGGAADVFSSFPVGRVLDAGVVHPRPGYLEFLDLASEGGARWLRARRHATLRLDEVTLTLLGPSADGTDRAGSARLPDANAASVAFRLAIGEGFAYVNTGDASTREEQEILAATGTGPVRAHVLKLGHHGSRTATAREWVEAVRPTVAVVSVGADNRYGHPHGTVLQTVRAAGVPHLWRTDRDGTLCVVVERDGTWAWGRPGGATRPGANRR
jgi:competence protein ComEC